MTVFILLLVFVSVTLLVAALGVSLLRRPPLERRLGAPAAEAGPAGLLRDRLVEGEDGTAAAMRRRLQAAGYSSAAALATFRTVRIGVALGLGGGALVLLSQSSFDLAPVQRLLMASCAAGMGWLWPPIWLDRLAARRRDAMRLGFPDSLDLLQVCIEAGLGLDAAIALVGKEIGKAHPLLGQQYQLLAHELRAGRSRDEALRAMAERLGLDEAKAFATILIQSDALGTSIVDALRAYAEDMRGRRMLAAEEKAQQLGVKMSVPLVGLILPALMLVIITPAAQKIGRLMMPLMSQNF